LFPSTWSFCGTAYRTLVIFTLTPLASYFRYFNRPVFCSCVFLVFHPIGPPSSYLRVYDKPHQKCDNLCFPLHTSNPIYVPPPSPFPPTYPLSYIARKSVTKSVTINNIYLVPRILEVWIASQTPAFHRYAFTCLKTDTEIPYRPPPKSYLQNVMFFYYHLTEYLSYYWVRHATCSPHTAAC